MLVRPTAQSVGLTEAQFESLGELDYQRDRRRNRVVIGGSLLIALCFLIWMLSPIKTQGLGSQIVTIILLSLFAWVLTAGVLYGVVSLCFRKPRHHEKLEDFHKKVLKFENTWREYYWKSFWDAVSNLSYHVEPGNDYPKTRLGFRDHWRISDASLFFVMNGKRYILYSTPEENSQFGLEAASKAVDSRGFYSADIMCLISPNGFSKESIEYLAKDHPNQFLFQIGEEATKLIQWLKTVDSKAPPIPLDVFAAANALLKVLRERQPPHALESPR